MARTPKSTAGSRRSVETLTHDEATRKNIPTAEYQSVMQKNEQDPVRVAYERSLVGLADEKDRRSRDLDPQLVWRGKDEQDWSDLVVHAPSTTASASSFEIRHRGPGQGQPGFCHP